MSTLDIRNFTRSRTPAFPFAKALAKTLPGWDLSLVFAGETRARSLNMTLRGKDYIPNVLAYETTSELARSRRGRSGEVIICPSVARRQAPSYGLSYPAMVGFLFIHGLLHLEGMAHGATMERREREILSSFIRITSTDGQAYRNRNRYRNASHQSRGGRRGDGS